MNSSYLWGKDEEWGVRYYFSYYSEFGERRIASIIEIVILCVTFFAAVGSNLGLAGCVLWYKETRTPTNLCLVNLAAADLLFAFGSPALAYTRYTQSWTLGEPICRLLPYSQFVCGFVLLWTLTLISMDRYRCLAVAPYRSTLTNTKVLVTSFLAWTVGAVLFLPAAFWFKPKEFAGGLTICTLVFPRNEIINVSLCFTVPVIILACFLPMTLLVYHYQRIFRRILNSRSRWAVPCVAQSFDDGTTGRRDSELSIVGTLISWPGRKSSGSSFAGRQGRTGSLSRHEEVRVRKHLRVARILLLNVIAVLLMWLPITIVILLIYLDGKRSMEDTGFFLKSHHFVWALLLAQLNTIVNPLLYGVFSENLRSCFTKLRARRRSTRRERERRRSAERVPNGSHKVSKSLEAIQDRLGAPRTPGSLRNSKKSSSCSVGSIGSIVEAPNRSEEP